MLTDRMLRCLGSHLPRILIRPAFPIALTVTASLFPLPGQTQDVFAATNTKKSYSKAFLYPLQGDLACYTRSGRKTVRLPKTVNQYTLPGSGTVLATPISRPDLLAKQRLLRKSKKRASPARKKLINKQLTAIDDTLDAILACTAFSIAPTAAPTTTVTPSPTPTPFAPRSVSEKIVDTHYGSHFTSTYYLVSEGETRPGEAALVSIEPKSSSLEYRASVRVYAPDEQLLYVEQQQRPANAGTIERLAASPATSLPGEPFALAKSGIYEVRVSSNSNVRVHISLPDEVQWGVSFQNGNFQPFTGETSTMYTWIPRHANRPLRLSLVPVDRTPPALPGQTLTPVLNQQSQVARYDLEIPSSSSEAGFVQPVSMPPGDWFEFRAYGMPFILSTSPEAATAIGAGIFRSQSPTMSGFLLSHRFQEEIASILPEMAPLMGDAAALSAAPGPNFPGTVAACSNPASDDDVYRFADILGYYMGTLPAAKWNLGTTGGRANQDSSATSAWIGTLAESLYGKQVCTSDFDCSNGSACQSGRCATPFDPSIDRWDRFQPFTYQHPLTSATTAAYAGRSPRGQLAYTLIWAAVTSTPCNPWGPLTPGGPLRYPELFYRGVAGALSDLLMLSESENLIGTSDTATDPYTGVAGFVLENTLPAFQLAAPYLQSVMTAPSANGLSIGARAYNAWKLGVERLFWRHYNDGLASSANQTAHHLVSFMSFALGVQNPEQQAFYQDLARRWAGHMFESIRPAGYFQENTGVCSSYTGIQMNMLGRYLGLTRLSALGADHDAESILSTVYGLFNHTAAPEPHNGPIFSGFNFNHRIGMGIELTQYGGAKFVADNVPEVGLWSRDRYATIAEYRSALTSWAQNFDAIAQNIPNVTMPGVPSPFNSYTSVPQTAHEFPAESSGTFLRNFGNEYIAVKRPGYFAGVYVGKPSAGGPYLHYREGYRTPTTDAALNIGGTVIEDLAPENEVNVSVYNYTPFTGGGLSLFWTPQYGAGIVGTTWSALAQNGLVAWQSGLRYWAEYFSTDFTLDADNGLLTVTGTIEDTPLSYTRSYAFLDNQIDITLTIQASADVTLEKLVEVIPVPTCTRGSCNGSIKNRKRLGATLAIPSTPALPDNQIQSANTLEVTDSDQNGMRIQFGQNEQLSLHRNGLRLNYWGDESQIGRAEVHLPSNWTQGQSRTLTYSISGISNSTQN